MVDDNTGHWGRREFLQATGAASTVATFGGVTAATPGRDPGPKEDELLIGVSSSTQMSTVQARVDRFLPSEAEVRKRNDDLGYMAVKMPDQASAYADSSFADTLKQTPGVKYVEKNSTHVPFSPPDDPKYGEQYAPQLVNAPDAWDETLGSEDVTIAVVDQGVKYDHPDLAGQFGADKGRDFVDNDSDPMPESSADEYHGTHVAGIAAGTTDNGTGVAGISNSHLLSCRALGTQGGSTSDIADAVQWAVDQGADVINMSLGGGGYTDTMKNAVQYAVNNGTLPICAAGNSGERGVSYPAKYDECIAVGAIDSNENLTDFSQYGPNLDVVAPGQDVLSCSTRNGGYEKLPGTSMACPATSGVAALGLAVHSGWSVSELRSKLKGTAVDVGLSEEKQGSGRVDAANLVGVSDGGGGSGNEAPTAKIDVSTTEPAVGETVTFDGSPSSDSDGSISEYYWETSGGASATGESVEGSWDSEQEVTISLQVTDDDGATDSTSVTIYVGGKASDNEAPVADFTLSSSTVTTDDTVDFDGSGSSDPDGSISTYEWDFGDGTTTTGVMASHSYGSAGDYTVSLTVTDGNGASDTASTSLTVESSSGGGQCGDTKETASVQDSLSGYWDSTSYSYTARLSDPCQVSISLDGPSYGDFDLYVTMDGRTPSTYDYDKKSVTVDSQEQVIVDTVAAGQEFGILVDSYEGDGSYSADIEELGK